MVKTKNQPESLEIDLISIPKFIFSNVKKLVSTALIFSIIFINFASKDTTYSGVMEVVTPYEKYNYESLNLLKNYIPSYVTMLLDNKKKNGLSKEKQKLISDTSYDEFFYNTSGLIDSGGEIKNLDSLVLLKSPEWIDQNIKGFNGRTELKRKNKPTLEPSKLFGSADFINSKYLSLKVSLQGTDKAYVKSALENTVVVLRRLTQYNFYTENLSALTKMYEIGERELLVKVHRNGLEVKKTLNRLSALERQHQKNLDKYEEGVVPLNKLKSLFENVPATTIPVEIVVQQTKLLTSDNNVESTRERLMELSIEADTLEEKKEQFITKRYFLNKHIIFIESQFKALHNPDINKIKNDFVSNYLKVPSDETTNLVAHSENLEFMSQVIQAGMQFQQYGPIIYSIETPNIVRTGIVGAIIGFLLMLTLLWINLIFRTKR